MSRPSPITAFYTPTIARPHPQQSMSIFPPSPSTRPVPWVIYIHGGAWRDPGQTKDMGIPLLLQSLPPTWGGMALDYRLSPAVQHPTHLEDVLTGLKLLVSEYGELISHIVIIGHSAGACLALQVLATLIAERKISGATRGVSTSLCDRIKALVGVEGIYDLVGLGKEYQSYKGFIWEAFGEDEELWDEASPSSFQWRELLSDCTHNAKVVLVQSTGDQLLSMNQTNVMNSILQDAGWKPEVKVINGGSHDATVESTALFDVLRDLYNYVDDL
ncbi:Alpha/Beta hydrolase protein [Lipomyces tetrasporus]|uniref:Kynurenine formamidase n=1 Tax=Lipomyces tetrasporus TaxID=54092 RepID=A0AAD7QVL1_9ASCO|nr:Alpha/Beta hydrolase protein [Lipomyces tetrasporus]KAJ8100592.1 Alpha/Beta hydrolase protein [Lipomyces tetrasporus]